MAIRELGLSVGALNPHSPRPHSVELTPTSFKQLRRGPVAASQLPPALLPDAHGEIRRPPS